MPDTQPTTEQYRLTVDYAQNLEKMIAAGHYDWVSIEITPGRFPIQGTGSVAFETRLFHFNRSIASEDVVKAIQDADPTHPWVPARIEHLLAFGAMYPDKQREYSVGALGFVGLLQGYRCVPCLHGYGGERSLRVAWWTVNWDDYYRFLAVRAT